MDPRAHCPLFRSLDCHGSDANDAPGWDSDMTQQVEGGNLLTSTLLTSQPSGTIQTREMNKHDQLPDQHFGTAQLGSNLVAAPGEHPRIHLTKLVPMSISVPVFDAKC
jgi:hypothetical protein